MRWLARIGARAEARRQSEVNARCRRDEARMVLSYGSRVERAMYLDASESWDRAGRPDVPLLTTWYRNRAKGLDA